MAVRRERKQAIELSIINVIELYFKNNNETATYSQSTMIILGYNSI